MHHESEASGSKASLFRFFDSTFFFKGPVRDAVAVTCFACQVPLEPSAKAEELDTPVPAGHAAPAAEDSCVNDTDIEDDIEIMDKPSEEEIAAAYKALPASAGLGPLEAALAAEAESLRAEAGEPERDLRREQLQKKAKDKAAKEQKKQEQEALKKQKMELKEAKAKERAQKKADKEEAAKQKVLAENKLAAPTENSPAAPSPDLAGEDLKPKKRPRGTGNPPGRPRGSKAKVKDADAQPKKRPRRTIAAQPGADVNIAAELTQFMQIWQNKVYDKTRDTLHKKKGVNVYDKNRTAAGIKNPGSPQFAYFSRTYSGTCSIAVNVFLVRKFYEKWEDKALDAAWPFSDEGKAYFLMLVQTADLAHTNMQPAPAS